MRLPRQSAAPDARVVADDVDAAEAGDRRVGEGLHLRGVAHVRDDTLDLDTGARQFGDRGVERGDLDVTDDDAHPLRARSAAPVASPIPLAPPVTTATLPCEVLHALFLPDAQPACPPGPLAPSDTPVRRTRYVCAQ